MGDRCGQRELSRSKLSFSEPGSLRVFLSVVVHHLLPWRFYSFKMMDILNQGICRAITAFTGSKDLVSDSSSVRWNAAFTEAQPSCTVRSLQRRSHRVRGRKQ